jgi:peptidoglycan LD-endopeptidase LytH
MRRMPRRGGLSIFVVVVAFVVGTLTGWWLRGGPPEPALSAVSSIEPAVPQPVDRELPQADQDLPPAEPQVVASSSDNPLARSPIPLPSAEPKISAAAIPPAEAIEELAARNLRPPIDPPNIEQWKGMFEQRRDANRRPHEAVDILAPRNTPVRAVEGGTIAKLFFSKAGGNTIYQFDPAQRFCYYYAHLERYAPEIADGQTVARGEVIGFVGTSGNAPPGTPHLHFAVFALDANHHWWEGRPLDPYLVFERSRGAAAEKNR